MDTAAEFRKYAANCKKMSKASMDPEAKALWRRMEERWPVCAKLAEEDARHQPKVWLQSDTLADSPTAIEYRLPETSCDAAIGDLSLSHDRNSDGICGQCHDGLLRLPLSLREHAEPPRRCRGHPSMALRSAASAPTAPQRLL
jgi:hypothetical protein